MEKWNDLENETQSTFLKGVFSYYQYLHALDYTMCLFIEKFIVNLEYQKHPHAIVITRKWKQSQKLFLSFEIQ